jgi:hypothetical protein
MARTEQHLYVTLDAIRRIRTRAGWNGPAHLLPYDPARYPSKQAHANARYKLKILERRAIGHIAMQCNLLTDIKQDALDMPKCSCQKCAACLPAISATGDILHIGFIHEIIQEHKTNLIT